MTLFYCTGYAVINQKTTTLITHGYHGEIWQEVTRAKNSTDIQNQNPVGKASSLHVHNMPRPAVGKDLDSLKPDLLQAAPGKNTVPSPNLKLSMK